MSLVLCNLQRICCVTLSNLRVKDNKGVKVRSQYKFILFHIHIIMLESMLNMKYTKFCGEILTFSVKNLEKLN